MRRSSRTSCPQDCSSAPRQAELFFLKGALIFSAGGSPAVAGGLVSNAPDARRAIAEDILEYLNQQPTRIANVRIEIRDARGNVKPGTEVLLTTRDGSLEVVGGEEIQTTADNGRVEASLRVSDGYDPGAFGVPEQLWSIDRDRVAVLLGLAASEFADGQFDLPDGDPRWTDQFADSRVFTGHSSRWLDAFTGPIQPDDLAMTTVDVPMVNHGHLMVLIHNLEGPLFEVTDPATGQPLDLAGETVLLFQGDTGLLEAETLAAAGVLFDDQAFVQNAIWPSVIADLLAIHDPASFTPTLEGIDPTDPPPGGDLKPVKVAAIVGEFALGFAPGYDVVDIVKEAVWKPLVADEETNWVIASVSFAGLLADAGYLAGGAPGVVANAATSAIKVALRHIPPAAARALLAMTGKATDSFRLLIDYFQKFPRPPGQSVFDWAVESVTSLINQWRRVLNSPLGIGADDFADGVRIIATRGFRTYTDEAVEGASYLSKVGKANVTSRLFDDFSEDVVEKTLDLTRTLDLPGGEISDDAIHGVAVAVEKVGVDSPLVREILEGAAMTPARIDLAFRNLDTLKGVNGLDEMIQFLRNNYNNTNGINGVIYESTFARRVVNGEVGGAGALERVSADQISGANRIDTITGNWAVQVKHKANQQLGLSDLSNTVSGQQYLDEMVEQAGMLGRAPVLVTNGGVTAPLRDALDQRGIDLQTVLD